MRSCENPFIEVFGAARKCLSASGGCFGFETAVHRRHTPPAPLKRGVLGCYFLFDSEMFECDASPLERG